MVDLINTSFAGGEAAPSFWGRTDEARFHVSASVIRNCFIDFRGGVKSRGGTAFVGPTWLGLSAPPRAITFRFNINNDFILVFGDQRMRVAYQGAYVTSAALSISSVSSAYPPVVTTFTPHGLQTGALVFITNVLGMTSLNANFYTVVVTGTSTLTLLDIFGVPVDAVGFPAYIAGGSLAPIYEISSPYAIADLPYMKFTQSADVMSITCVNTQTGTEYPPYDLDRVSNTNWSFVETTFQVSIAAPTNLTSVASSVTPPTTTPPTLLTGYSYVVTAVSATTGEESQPSTATNVQSVDIATLAGSITLTWTAVTGAAYYNVYKAPAAYGTNVPIGSQYGFAGQTFGTQFTDTNITADATTTPPLHVNPFARGQVLQVNVTSPGSGLTQAGVTWSITSATGSGFAGSPIVVAGALAGFYVQNPGQNYLQGDFITIGGSAGVAATGTYTFTINPVANQTIVLNGVAWTFVATGATGAQTNIRANVTATLNQLASDLNASASGSINVATYSVSGLVLTVTYGTVGTAGNAYTLAVGSYAGTISGSTLTGGLAATGSGGAAVSVVVGPQSGTYPSVVGYFQQRRVYAGTANNPDTYFMSQTGAYTNMDSSSPPVDNDSIIGNPWAQQVNGIQWIEPMPGGLIVGTGLDVWQLAGTSGSGSPVTPAQQSAQPQESSGFHPLLPPIKIERDILYFQSLGTIVRDLEYNFFVNIYAGADISLYSNHLFENYQFVQWAWAKEPYKIVWAVRNDGKLLSLTYVKEQKVAGWSRHDTNGQFVSVTCASEPPVNAPYFIVQRYIPGASRFMYYLERMDDRLWQAAEDCWCVDCGLSLPRSSPNASLSASSATGIGTLVNPAIVTGGGNYTDPQVVVFDPSNPSLSVNATVTLTAGVITGFTVTGVGFTATQVRITDATGAGAALTVGVQNQTTFTASAAVFSMSSVGQVIRMGGGVATVVALLGSQQVVAAVNSPIVLTVPNDPAATPVVAQAGAWTIATPITTITNLSFLNGLTVSALADGNVYTGLVVQNGQVTLGAPASDIKIGLPFVAQLQALHTDVPGGQTIQGKPMRVSKVTVRMEKTRGLQVGANQPIASTYEYQQEVGWGATLKMEQLQDRTTNMTYGQAIPLFTGDKELPIRDMWRVQLNQSTYGMVAVQQLNPLPLGVTAFCYQLDVAQ